MNASLKRKILFGVIGGVGGPVVVVSVLGLVFLMAVAGALGGGGTAAATTGTATTQVGHCSVAALAKAAPSWSTCVVYPATAPHASERAYLPAPSASALQAMTAIPTSYQAPLMAKCYRTWIIPTYWGGTPCDLSGYPGQCTFWALWNWANPAVTLLGGNADQFWGRAQSMGIATSPTPVVGSIVVWGASAGYSSFGHVAIVVAVTPTLHTFVVSEQNFLTPWEVDYRVVSSTPGGVGYGNLQGFLLPATGPGPAIGGPQG